MSIEEDNRARLIEDLNERIGCDSESFSVVYKLHSEYLAKKNELEKSVSNLKLSCVELKFDCTILYFSYHWQTVKFLRKYQRLLKKPMMLQNVSKCTKKIYASVQRKTKPF